METNDVYAVIMAGGIGSRLWPESRQKCPKQFLSFFNNEILLTATVKRVLPFIPLENIIVVTNRESSSRVRQLLPTLPSENILAEPYSRNTAPCIGWAATELLRRCTNPNMLVLPSDHYIYPNQLFIQTIINGLSLLNESEERLIVFGIKPTEPRTTYGYIKGGQTLLHKCSDDFKFDAFNVDCFIEKPCYEKAVAFINSGRYLWNSGIFLWKAQTILARIHRYMPDLKQQLDRLFQVEEEQNRDKIYQSLQNISIDYAILEQSQDLVVLPCNFQWSDLGSFRALEELYSHQKDDWGNVAVHSQLITLDAQNNHVRRRTDSLTDHLTILVDVDDLLVVETEGITLIVKKGEEQKIQKVLQRLSEENRTEYL